jgi:hypothetical protein
MGPGGRRLLLVLMQMRTSTARPYQHLTAFTRGDVSTVDEGRWRRAPSGGDHFCARHYIRHSVRSGIIDDTSAAMRTPVYLAELHGRTPCIAIASMTRSPV